MRQDLERFQQAIESCLPVGFKDLVAYSYFPDSNDFVIAYDGPLLHAIVGALSIGQDDSFNAQAFSYAGGDYRSIRINASFRIWFSLIDANRQSIKQYLNQFYRQTQGDFKDPFVAFFLERFGDDEYDLNKVDESFDLFFRRLSKQSALPLSEAGVFGSIVKYVSDECNAVRDKKDVFEEIIRMIAVGTLSVSSLNELLREKKIKSLFRVVGRMLFDRVGRAQHLIEDLYKALGVTKPEMAAITERHFPNPCNYEFILENAEGRTVRFTYAALEAVMSSFDFGYTQYAPA